MSRRLGLIIGINHYSDNFFRQLRFAENDAHALAQWLVNAKGGKWAASDVQRLQGEHATKELTESLITQTCLRLAEPGDLVLFYFAGHSFVDERSGEGYLALANTQFQDPTTALHLSSLYHHVFAQSRATHIVCIIDSFQTGLRGRMDASQYSSKEILGAHLLSTLQQQRNRLFLCSCRGNESAPEVGERNLGLLAYRAIVGLSGAASDSQGRMTLRQLHSYLFASLGEQHRPQLFGQDEPPLVLVGDMSSGVVTPSTAMPNKPSLQFRLDPAIVLNARASIDDTQRAQSRTNSTPSSTPNIPSMQGLELPASAQVGASIPPLQISPSPPKNFNVGTSAPILTEQQGQMLFAQAQQLFLAHRYPEAVQVLEQLLVAVPTNGSALTLKGQILGTMGYFHEALSVVEQLIQINAHDPLAWSMRAVVLTNIMRHQEALTSIDRSIALDPANPETQAIRATILAALGTPQATEKKPQAPAASPAQEQMEKAQFHLFSLSTALSVAGFLCAIAGMLLPVMQPRLPIFGGLLIASLGAAVLWTNAFRGAYRYGLPHLLFTCVLCLGTGGTLGTLAIVSSTKIFGIVKDHPALLVPLLFFGGWLLLMASVPVICAGAGVIAKRLQRRQ